MSYEVTVIKIETVKKVKKPTWQQVDKEGNYGYPPQVEVEEEVESKVFQQRVDEINLPDVIKAVNGL